MRYLSWFFIVALMYISWSVAHTPLKLSEGTHIDIQEDIKLMITETMYKYLPTVDNFKFEKFWTENLKDGGVRADFTFNFNNTAEGEQGAIYGIDGYAKLKPNENRSVWTIEKLVFNNNAIEFEEGMTIRADEDLITDDTTEENSEE